MPRTARHRLRPAAIALAAVACCCASGARAGIFTVTGDTTGGPTFTRALVDFSNLSGVGIGVAYATYSFTVTLDGAYTVLSTTAFDGFAFLYAAPFDPSSPLDNGVIANDDLLGATTSGFQIDLLPGAEYTIVQTGYAPSDFGAFSITVGGPGEIVGTLATPMPEPANAALLALGLGALALGRRWHARRAPVTLR